MEIESTVVWNELLIQAENGDVAAMNEVAFWLREGVEKDGEEIVQVDKKASFQWTIKAFELGSLEATEQYADYLTDYQNEVCEPDVDLGMKLYERCYQEGSKRAAFCLGLEFRNMQQFEKAFAHYMEAQEVQNEIQDLIIAQSYYYGIGVNKNRKKALEILESLDKEKNTPYEMDEANYLIGRIYLEGEVVKQDLSKARLFLELADQDGDHRSAQELLILIGRSDLLRG